ncbi:DUF6084 family protein [Paraburkholderia phenazinium]|jgi:hypothetical protein|uniref:Uncharacterized protein n=1 Tax=Paraburkholderia phenazinium TaxID=60549 RepID=A0A1G8B2B1_9BURK|nr:DUF6084 family protein [Paraburkholderia phenazinium]SDH27318.1 hypothetical protein SAMN05216466_108197 [Paraburkholderia phenazinium]
MPDLAFTVERAEVAPYAAAPLLLFKLRIVTNAATTATTNATTTAATPPASEPVASITLQCQIQIEATRRRYVEAEQEGLQDLFGTPQRWGETLRTMLWTHTTVVVPPFEGECVIDLPVPCSYDFNVAATKYFHALESAGEIPLMLQFSGTVFYRDADDALQVAPIPWHKEAAFRLPVSLWRDMMERYYPNGAWLCLQREVFDRLSRYKTRHGLASWEQTVDGLLDGVEEDIS